MADMQHLTILKRGVDSWNAWRQRAGESPDLSEAELPGAELEGIDLGDVQLGGGDLYRADLRLADLRRGHLEGANLAGCDLSGADLSESELYDADLQGADLSGANLEAASLSEAQLFEADLSQARLTAAQLDSADLGAARLQLTDLEDADLRAANLRGADLRGCQLASAHLGGADLRCANLAGARLHGTTLVDLDLSRVKGLRSAVHLGPSSIGTDTLAKTAVALAGDDQRLQEVEVFYRGAGVEPHLIEYYRTRCGLAPKLKACYVVHHPDDRGFASLLHDELQARAVTCWLDPGERGTCAAKTARGRGVKVVLCVSGPALESLWARDQLAFARGKALARVREVLMIVDLDGRLSSGWGGAEADRLRDLVVADFSGLASQQTKLEDEIEKVVEGLAG